uniref:Nitroreductase n=1 Tax=Desulfovibrio sp. U5L TaxID=596152 RepID=I2PX25_9BACT
MDRITINVATCQRDGMCAAVCPSGCIEMGADGLPARVPDAVCIACGHCVAVCPHGAFANSRVDAAKTRPVPKRMPEAEAVRGLMLSRRSIRAYKDTPVTPETMTWLLDTARCAPTAVNTQKVFWIACLDPAKTRSVAALCIEWLRRSNYSARMVEMWDRQGQDTALRGAPAFAAAYSPADDAWGAVDCAIALTYMELAAASAGLGACFAGLLTTAAREMPALAALLDVPEGHVVHGGLMLGYPKYRYRLIPPRNEAYVRWM